MVEREVLNMKTNLKQKLNTVKEWCGEHKMELIAGATIVGGAILLIVAGKKLQIKKLPKAVENDIPVVGSSFDYGRYCLMKFFVEDTGEFLGEVGCYESFVEDMLCDVKITEF